MKMRYVCTNFVKLRMLEQEILLVKIITYNLETFMLYY